MKETVANTMMECREVYEGDFGEKLSNWLSQFINLYGAVSNYSLSEGVGKSDLSFPLLLKNSMYCLI